MANREGRSSAVRRYDEPEAPLGPVRPRDTSGILTIPTGSRRHMSHIREGVIRYDEVFMRDRVRRLPVDPDALEGGGKADDASKKQKAAKVGVRGKGRGVGKKAPLQQDQAKEEINVKAARQKKVKKK